jgi:ABC-type sugar transport system permease subunit
MISDSKLCETYGGVLSEIDGSVLECVWIYDSDNLLLGETYESKCILKVYFTNLDLVYLIAYFNTYVCVFILLYFLFKKDELTCEMIVNLTQCSSLQVKGKTIFCAWDYSSERCVTDGNPQEERIASFVWIVLIFVGSVSITIITTIIIAVLLWRKKNVKLGKSKNLLKKIKIKKNIEKNTG